MFNLFKKTYQTLNKIEVSRGNLLSNYQYLSEFNPKINIAPVLKSNAYGHGIVEVAKSLDSQNAPFFCVDSLYEAYELLKARTKTPILIMGYTNPENFKVKKLPFSFTIFDLKTAAVLNKYQPGAGIHLKIDTGMHRLGIPVEELPMFLKALKKLPNLNIEGVMSHFASATGPGDILFKKQIKNFIKAQEILFEQGIYPKWSHIAASSALIHPQLKKELAQVSNLGRAGISLYGISPNLRNNKQSLRSHDLKLQPVLKLTTKLAQVKRLNKGDKVGYDGTFKASKKMLVGLLPIGYFDGVDRRLSNQGFIYIRDIACPILGRVSMNITAVDITKIEKPKTGEEVVVFSNNPQDKNSIQKSAEICQTIPYELLIHLDPSIKREVI